MRPFLAERLNLSPTLSPAVLEAIESSNRIHEWEQAYFAQLQALAPEEHTRLLNFQQFMCNIAEWFAILTITK